MEESKESAVQKRRMEGRKRFITNFIYFIILGGIFLFVMKRFVPMFFPFILGLAVAAVLSPLIGKLCEKTGGKRALVSIVVLLVFYGLLVLAALFSASHVVTFIQNLAGKLPQFYVEVIEPELGILFERIVVSFPEYQDWVSQMSASLENALQSGIMTVSGTLIGWGASWIVGFPAILVQTIFTIISSFFFTIDYDRIWDFVLRQFKRSRGR